MKSLSRYFSWLSEALVILLVLLVINNYLGNKELLIKADGKGYYDYLPATFIYHDLNFNYTDTLKTEYYDHKVYSSGYLPTINGRQMDKYFPGVAILWTPFFLGAHYYALHNNVVADGYSWPYQRSIFYAAIFYLWLGLLYLRKLLTLLNINVGVIFLVQVLLVLATPLINYVQYDPSFTHVYSFSVISIFTYFSFRYLKYNKQKDVLIAATLLGLITIIRPVNLMVIGVILLYFKSFEELASFTYRAFTELLKPILLSLIPFLLIVGIVPMMWYYQTGQFFVWGYENEAFNFLHPEFMNFLFSFRKGLFIHTPFLFFAFIGAIVVWVKQKNYYLLVSYVLLLTLISYVLSSWWSWFYGASFGQRPMIDFYVIFAIGLAYFLNEIKNRIVMLSTVLVFGLFIPINLIQAFQFQNYIIDWREMTYEKFEIIGLHTEKKYNGIFFKNRISYSKEDIVFSKHLNFDAPIVIEPSRTAWFDEVKFDSTYDLSSINYVVVEADIEFKEGTGDVILTIDNYKNQGYYWYSNGIFSSLLKENTRAVGIFYYEIPQIKSNSIFHVAIDSGTDEVKAYGITVKFISMN